jgi:hypothetical protein
MINIHHNVFAKKLYSIKGTFILVSNSSDKLSKCNLSSNITLVFFNK